MTGESEQEAAVLWQSYRSSGDPDMRERLIVRYGFVARMIAATIYGDRPDNAVPFDDYLQYARVGLIEAIDRYDVMRGTSFETFSSYRIRGAILNGLSHETELRAILSRREYRVTEREESILGAKLAQPQAATLEEFVRWSVGLAVGFILEDEVGRQADESSEANPYAQAEISQLRVRVRGLVDQLPDRERQVMRRHYYEHLEFQAIAAEMGITKGRVSQLHARALARVREWLNSTPQIDRNL